MLKKNAIFPMIKRPVLNVVANAIDKSMKGRIATAPQAINDIAIRK